MSRDSKVLLNTSLTLFNRPGIVNMLAARWTKSDFSYTYIYVTTTRARTIEDKHQLGSIYSYSMSG